MTAISAEYIKSVVNRIVSEKDQKNIVPSYATMTEVTTAIRDDALECMRQMCKDKTLNVRKTLNSVAFSVPQTEEKQKDGE